MKFITYLAKKLNFIQHAVSNEEAEKKLYLHI